MDSRSDFKIAGFDHSGVSYPSDYTGWSSDSGADHRIDEGGYEIQDYTHNNNSNDWAQRNQWPPINGYYRDYKTVRRATRMYY